MTGTGQATRQVLSLLGRNDCWERYLLGRKTMQIRPANTELRINIGDFGGRHSALGIVTSYRLDGPGIESRWRQPFRPALGPTQPPVQLVPGLFPGSKEDGAWR